MKHYGQACAIARALDIIGDRWNLLLVRELTLGPRRYRDLATGQTTVTDAVAHSTVDGDTDIAHRALQPLFAALTTPAPAI